MIRGEGEMGHGGVSQVGCFVLASELGGNDDVRWGTR